MSGQGCPHLFLETEKSCSSIMLRYTGYPEATYTGSFTKEPDILSTAYFLCDVVHIKKVTIQPKYLLIKASAITIKIPHTPQTFRELHAIITKTPSVHVQHS